MASCRIQLRRSWAHMGKCISGRESVFFLGSCDIFFVFSNTGEKFMVAFYIYFLYLACFPDVPFIVIYFLLFESNHTCVI